MVVFVGAILCLRRSQTRQSSSNVEFLLFWQRYFVLSFLTMLFWQIAGQPVLQLLHTLAISFPLRFWP